MQKSELKVTIMKGGRKSVISHWKFNSFHINDNHKTSNYWHALKKEMNACHFYISDFRSHGKTCMYFFLMSLFLIFCFCFVLFYFCVCLFLFLFLFLFIFGGYHSLPDSYEEWHLICILWWWKSWLYVRRQNDPN